MRASSRSPHNRSSRGPGTPDALAIRTAGLSKSYGKLLAVDGLGLEVPEGSVFGFLGPNGSGKTTTIRMLMGLSFGSTGRIELLGRPIPDDCARVLPDVGALIEGPAFYPFLSGRKNLIRFDAVGRDREASTRPQRADDALARVGLSAAADKVVRAYSSGMRQRLALAATVMRPRRLLILDEPTNGLDPQGTREVRNLIRTLASERTTVFLSSHLLSEVDQICTHVGVMSNGRLVAQGPIGELRSATRPMLRIETTEPDRAASVLAGINGVGAVTVTGNELRVVMDAVTPEECNARLVAAGVPVRALVTEVPSLEDVFVSLTGEGFDVAQ